MAVIKTKLIHDKILSCALLINVKNAGELRSQLLSGNLQCAIIKPCLIADIFQINVATNRALLAESLERLITKTVYTEILFNLSISKNISQSLVKFGINDTDTEMIVVSLSDESEMSRILSKIDGDLVDIAGLNQWVDKSHIKRAYKINESETSVSSLLNIIVSKIATKDFMSH